MCMMFIIPWYGIVAQTHTFLPLTTTSACAMVIGNLGDHSAEPCIHFFPILNNAIHQSLNLPLTSLKYLY